MSYGGRTVGATVTARARAPAMACVGGPGRLGRASVGDSLRWAVTAVAAPPEVLPLRSFYWGHGRCLEGAPSVPTEARMP